MKRNSNFLLVTAVLMSIILCACSSEKVEKMQAVPIETQEDNLNEEGHDKPAAGDKEKEETRIKEAETESQVRIEAEADCRTVMQEVRNIYKATNLGKATDGMTEASTIAAETIGQMQKSIALLGYPVTSSDVYAEMSNYTKIEKFILECQQGNPGEIIYYVVHLDGSIGRVKLSFDGMDMYEFCTNTAWSEDNAPIIRGHSFTKIKWWEYTEKGWFLFEYCVPEPPEVSEVVNTDRMLRIKPWKEEYRTFSINHLFPLGYQGNNILCSDWDQTHLEGIDYNGLYEYLYAMKYKLGFDGEQYQKGVPKEEFEKLMMEYLPVKDTELEKYAVCDAKTQTYAWSRLGCFNYAPNAFGTAIPEVTDMQENEDGTLKVTVDAVCEMMGTDCCISHILTVRLSGDGDIQYLGNQILEKEGQDLNYQYRFKE